MDDMHRAVNLETGKIKMVSSKIAKQTDLLLSYGYILQELPTLQEAIDRHEAKIQIELNTTEAIKKAEKSINKKQNKK